MDPGASHGDVFHGSKGAGFQCGKQLSLVANEITLGETQAESRLFSKLNDPKRHFSWYDRRLVAGGQKMHRFSSHRCALVLSGMGAY